MKVFFKTVLTLSGILPATYLMFWLVLLFFIILTSGSWDIKSALFIGLILLAIAGYVGLLFLFFEEKVKKEKIIGLLLAGVVSFIMFNSISDNWNQVFSPSEPTTFFMFTWPTIVAVINIIRLILKPSDQRMKPQ
jgi:ABC-type enterochelin transport system permease subunit